jgi:MFS transporter, DHA1 family, multidrug resistance protein
MVNGLKPTIISALVLALASFGDALLYPVLPVNAVEMGVPIIWVGVLLSINRFVRLASNQIFAWLFNSFGYKRITIIAALFAALSTFSYGVVSTIYFWLAARIIWGLCYSSLRISCISYSLEGNRPGFQLGLSRGMQEIGPIIALFAGPIILHYTSVQATFIIFSILSLSAVLLAFQLPELPTNSNQYTFTFKLIPSSFNFLVFTSALFVEGLLVVLIGQLFDSGQISLIELTALAAFYIGYRRLSNVIVSPLAGRIADRFGIERVFLVAILLTVISLVLISAGFLAIGILATFTFQSISSALSPGEAAREENRLNAIAANTTWRDLGAASGALITGVLVGSKDLHLVVFAGAVVLLLALTNHIIRKKNFKEILIWK